MPTSVKHIQKPINAPFSGCLSRAHRNPVFTLVHEAVLMCINVHLYTCVSPGLWPEWDGGGGGDVEMRELLNAK